MLGTGAVLVGLISLGQSNFKDAPSPVTAASPNSQAATASSTTIASGAVAIDASSNTVGTAQLIQPAEQDVSGDEPSSTGVGCKIDKRSLRLGDSGASVTCVQQALIATGYLSGAPSGQYDDTTFSAVNKLQKEKDLFVDGLVGRETALALEVWPDEASLVVRTPPPADGAVDLLGYPLSFVATSGPDAPPLPASSGGGKRVVYDRAGQRGWAVDKNDRVIRSWLVAGSKYNNEMPGTHKVFSRSEVSTAWNGKAFLPKMIRWLKTDIGNIGFHGIPRHVSDGSRYMKDSELGNRLSGGCQRQADLDAAFMWDFAQVGTTVVVI
ncbi:MAG: L,D-transpeptidase family protein [Actinomycetota bacterium]|nr:L,D-transpeptidase family protein [Actinomycetota bacterium]